MRAMSEPDQGVRRLRLLALLFLLLGGLGFVAYQASYPYTTTVAITELTRDSDGFLVGDFSTPWPLKIQRTALDQVAVMLPDGTTLQRHLTRRALELPESGSGFLVERPEIVFRLDAATEAGSDQLTVTVPVKGRDILYQLPFGIAAALFLLSWWRPIGAILRGRRAGRPALASGVIAGFAGLLGLFAAAGPTVWLALIGLLGGPLIAAAVVLRAEAEMAGTRRRWDLPLQLALVLVAVLGSCALAELYLGWQGSGRDGPIARSAVAQERWFQLPDDIVQLAYARGDVLTLPNAWQHREETIEGASRAYTWHDALHVYDQSGFRRLNGPFPAKDPRILRIMVVGDSLTYGEGIAEEWTFSRLLERALQENYRVEVINLGVRGFQSEDILDVLHRFLPQLDPDLVVYAVCLNDFLPSGQLVQPAYGFPFPKDWKEYLLERTALARLLDDGFLSLLLALDLRWDFFDDILAGGEAYQARFARDIAAMDRVTQDAGLPPIIGIVFNQFPGGDPRAWDLVEIAEQSLDDAGLDLIPVRPWRERFRDRIFPVSRWEAHPNELAHSLIADHLYERLILNSKLKEYRIGEP
jgi:lysophospholipase L1-like esterase